VKVAGIGYIAEGPAVVGFDSASRTASDRSGSAGASKDLRIAAVEAAVGVAIAAGKAAAKMILPARVASMYEVIPWKSH